MSRKELLTNAAILAAVWYVLLPSPAHAYFDLGTGTYMVQLIMGFGAAMLISFRHTFSKFFKKPVPSQSTIDKTQTEPPKPEESQT